MKEILPPPPKKKEVKPHVLTVQLWVQLLEVGWDCGNKTLDAGLGRTDLKARVIGQHGQHWNA